MRTMDQKLLNYYLELKGPEAGPWNTSPACLHTEQVTRDFIRKHINLTHGIRVCNVGIGTGDWDDFLGYWLNGHGILTSIDIDNEICEIFAYRQMREGHPNPAQIHNKSIFDKDLPSATFDVVTLIGSAIQEIGEFRKCMDACFRLLKDDGQLLLMINSKYKSEKMIDELDYEVLKKQHYPEFPEYPFSIILFKM
ncbi:class I SAM-dependent methyltransferase [Sutcliffiella rhizosphaerae]|uniref:Class I SAM-dependent methyltransferase n=1 Tax=Sutcliffiella rhizosphaerae TaxID=2880967 RepID=A0ABM8YMI6_9BACI|nr:class I SAM-dependent methyltransferase [Sutcliffiella rhizosphaerae]CAG9621117.1 hypothetical protein BACCIP111883_01889 [Sutcliffiella rhizosphaerae]